MTNGQNPLALEVELTIGALRQCCDRLLRERWNIDLNTDEELPSCGDQITVEGSDGEYREFTPHGWLLWLARIGEPEGVWRSWQMTGNATGQEYARFLISLAEYWLHGVQKEIVGTQA